MGEIERVSEIKFPLNLSQAVCVATEFINKAGKDGAISSRKLMKLLYIAERRSLEKNNRPIVGGCYRAMDHGPVQSEIYRILQPSVRYRVPLVDNADIWRSRIVKTGTTVKLKSDDSACDIVLSLGDQAIISGVLLDFAGYSPQELIDYCHSFPEWKTAYERVNNKWISYDEIVEAIDSSGSIRKAAIVEAENLQQVECAIALGNKRYGRMLERLAH